MKRQAVMGHMKCNNRLRHTHTPHAFSVARSKVCHSCHPPTDTDHAGLENIYSLKITQACLSSLSRCCISVLSPVRFHTLLPLGTAAAQDLKHV